MFDPLLFVIPVSLSVLQCKSKGEGLKEMHTLAISRFYLPGEAQFPLNAMYSKPTNRQEEGRSIYC